MPEKTLQAFGDHGEVGETLPKDGGDAEETLKAFNDAGIDTEALGTKLQEDGKRIFVDSWNELLETIAAQTPSAA
jgi:transaldolase